MATDLAVVLVLGHAELPLLLTGTLAMRALMAMALTVLIASVIVADYAAIRTMRRISVLHRNRATLMLWEHGLFLGFVLTVELSTYALVLSVLDRDPGSLLASTPLVPTEGPLFWAQIGLRATLVTWTAVQLYIVSAPLPIQWATLDAKSLSLLGGHAQAALERLELRQTDIAAVFNAFAAVSRRPPRRQTWWNGWLVRRDQEVEVAETRHQQEVIRALEGLSQDRAAESLAERTAVQAELAEARAMAQQAHGQAEAAIAQAQQEIAEVRAAASAEALQAARAQIAEAFLHLMATGEAPAWLAEMAPTAAETLPLLLTKGRRLPRSVQSIHKDALASTAPEGSLDALRELLRTAGIVEAARPAGKRGVWVPTSAVDVLSGSEVTGVDAAKLTREKGGTHKEGHYYIAPADALVIELGKRKQLRADFAMWLDTRQQRTAMNDENIVDAGCHLTDASTVS